jgi:alkanesulfonate monooxygenase SsuD/methylene tetrahydromethanopterin reductase-like flavin-dependent oxidoreductase (luciferase family)
VIERHGDTVGRDTDQIEKTIMMGLCYGAPAEREKAALARVTAMSGATVEQARRQIMIGSREECLETIDRYIKVGVTHFIFTLPRPFFMDEVQRFAEEVIPAVRANAR